MKFDHFALVALIASILVIGVNYIRAEFGAKAVNGPEAQTLSEISPNGRPNS